MDVISTYLPAVAMLLGHLALLTWLYNRLHASGLPSRLIQRIEMIVIAAIFGSLLLVASWLWRQGGYSLQGSSGFVRWLVPTWAVTCWCMLSYVLFCWAARRWWQTSFVGLLNNDTEIVDLKSLVGTRLYGDRRTSMLGRIPGNQLLEVHFQHEAIVVDNLPPALNGLRIAQVTDLHMTGRLTREFFDVVIQRMNQWDAEIVAITGDLVDKSACIEWVPATLGQLTSRYGTYALLGNHDQRLTDVRLLRGALTDCGIEDVGGRSLVRRIRDTDVLLTGNECPWFPPAPPVPHFADQERPFSILLSHSPDPLPWARRHRFDLMLAGHTHGGQICFPLIGPVVCPSRYGVRYASGLFHAPPTLMHVSRGLSGVHTVRFNCPPEVTLLELRCGH